MILFALALFASAPADAVPTPALTPSVKTVTPKAQPLDDYDKLVCHSDFETGSRLSVHKECHTKREWYQMQTGEQAYLDQAIHKGTNNH